MGKFKIKVKLSVLMLYLAVISVLSMLAVFSQHNVMTVSADDLERPGQFKDTVVSTITEDITITEPAGVHTIVNSKIGYALYSNTPTDNSNEFLLKIVGGRNIDKDGNETDIEVANMVLNDGTTNMVARGISKGEGAASVVKWYTDKGLTYPGDAEFRQLFFDKYDSLRKIGIYANKNNPTERVKFTVGVSRSSSIDTWSGWMPKNEFWCGDYSTFKSPSSWSFLMVSAVTGEAHVMYSKFAEVVGATGGASNAINKFGQVVTDPEIHSAANGNAIAGVPDNQVVQVFEKAMILENGTVINGTYNHNGGVNPSFVVDDFVVVSDLPNSGVFGSTDKNDSSKVVINKVNPTISHHFYNYTCGFVYLTTNNSTFEQSTHQKFGGWNFDLSNMDFTTRDFGNTPLTRAEITALADVHKINLNERIGRSQDGGTDTNVRDALVSGGSEYSTRAEITPIFQDKYEEIIPAFKPGIDRSGIKIWDGSILQQFSNGDSTGVMEGREYGSALIYNPEIDEVFFIKDNFSSAFSNANAATKRSFGFPLSDSDFSVTVDSEQYNVMLWTNGIMILENSAVEWKDGWAFDPDSEGAATGEFIVGDFVTVTDLPNAAVFGTTDKYDEAKVIINKTNATISHHFYNYTCGLVYLTVNNSTREQSTPVIIGGWNFDLTDNEFKTKNFGETAMNRSAVSDIADVHVMTIAERIGRLQDATTDTAVSNALRSAGSDYTTREEIAGKFQERYEEIIEAFKPGIDRSGIKVWESHILQQFSHGDSTELFEKSDRPFGSALFYNPNSDEIFLIKDKFSLFFSNADANTKRNFGFPLSDSDFSVTVDSEQYNVMLWTNGIMILDDDTVEWNEGMFFIPDAEGSLVGEFGTNEIVFAAIYGEKVGSSFEFDGFTYQNLDKGYAYYKYSEELSEHIIKYVPCINVSVSNNKLVRVAVDEVNYLYDAETRQVVTTDGGDDVESLLGTITETDKANIKTAFINAWKDAVENQLWGIGFCASNIKKWHNNIVLEFKDGEGAYNHDSSRKNFSFLVMDLSTFTSGGTADDIKVYLVGQYAAMWGESAIRSAVLYPKYNVIASKTIIFEGESSTFSNIQIFENGFIYTDGNTSKVVVGYSYNEADNKFVIKPVPKVPSQYGVIKQTLYSTNGKITYLNYTNGAITATLQEGVERYVYEYFPGRYFEKNGDSVNVKKYPVSQFISVETMTFEGRLPQGIDADQFKKKIVDKFTEYFMEKDIFLGFPTYAVKPWNDIWAQQFLWGDSTSMIFGYDRQKVAAIMLNNAEDKVYAVYSDVMDVWGSEDKPWQYLYYPISELTYNESVNKWIQEFDGGIIIVAGSGHGYVISDITLDDFLSMADYDLNPSHGKSESNGYVSDEGEIVTTTESSGCNSYISTVALISLAFILIGIAIIILKQRKKTCVRTKNGG